MVKYKVLLCFVRKYVVSGEGLFGSGKVAQSNSCKEVKAGYWLLAALYQKIICQMHRRLCISVDMAVL